MQPQYENQPLPPPPPNVYNGPQAADKWWQEPWVGIVCTFLCCGPLGLYLVWTSPKNTDSTKKIVTAIWAGLFLLGIVANIAILAAGSTS